MPKILLVGVFGDIEDFENNDRLNNVIRYAQGLGDVSLLTSTFSHKKKSKRVLDNELPGVTISYVQTLPYRHNTSFRRFFSHFLLGIASLPKLWRLVGHSDLIYVFSPPITFPLFAAIIAKIRGKLLAVDFTDLWPQAFGLISKATWQIGFFKPLLIPQFLLLKLSDHRIAINSLYVEELKKIYNKEFLVLPLGIAQRNQRLDFDTNDFNELNSIKLKIGERCVFVFGGNLGTAYDFDFMLDIVEAYERRFEPVFLLICGDGTERSSWEKRLNSRNSITYHISGRLEYGHYLTLLELGDFGFNLYRPTNFISTSYKMYDYLLSDLWILNNLKGDAHEMIAKYQLGVNCSPSKLEEALQQMNALRLVNSAERNARFTEAKAMLNQQNLGLIWRSQFVHNLD